MIFPVVNDDFPVRYVKLPEGSFSIHGLLNQLSRDKTMTWLESHFVVPTPSPLCPGTLNNYGHCYLHSLESSYMPLTNAINHPINQTWLRAHHRHHPSVKRIPNLKNQNWAGKKTCLKMLIPTTNHRNSMRRSSCYNRAPYFQIIHPDGILDVFEILRIGTMHGCLVVCT